MLALVKLYVISCSLVLMTVFQHTLLSFVTPKGRLHVTLGPVDSRRLTLTPVETLNREKALLASASRSSRVGPQLHSYLRSFSTALMNPVLCRQTADKLPSDCESVYTVSTESVSE